MASPAIPSATDIDVLFMIGHDDDQVLDPSVRPPGCKRARVSQWTGKQSDVAIAEAVLSKFPRLRGGFARTVEDLLATEARVVVVLSYLTQASYAWYDKFFGALDALEGRGVVVYPSSAFKRHISSKAAYMAALQERGLPVCPTQILLRGDCVGDDGAPAAARVEAKLRAPLGALGEARPSWLAGAKGFQLVSKPSNADGGFGVAFWSGSLPQIVGKPTAADDDANVAADAAAAAANAGGALGGLRLCTLLTAGSSEGAEARRAVEAAAGSEGGGQFCEYLRRVGFADLRPELLLQPFLPQLAHHFEIKIYFLRRQPFYAVLTYGKEKLLAKVVRPSTDAALFAWLQPLIAASKRALDALPPDGPHDPKVLMRVDWGCAGGGEDEGGGGGGGADDVAAALRRDIVQRASSLGPPQKKLARAMAAHADGAPLSGDGAHIINEIELHPGFYVDWDETPDQTIEPLAQAYGEYIQRVVDEQAARAAA